MNDPLPRLGRYGMSAPTASDFIRAIRNVTLVGIDEIWGSLCDEAGVEPGAVLLTVDQAKAVAAAMTGRRGRLGIAGRALTVRVDAYAGLVAQPGSAGGFPADWGSTTLGFLIRERPIDDARADAIAALDLFSPEVRVGLDRVAERISRLLGAPVGLVTLVTEDAQIFLGSHGLPEWAQQQSGSPVEWSFCANVVRDRAEYLIGDATQDVIQRGNPVVANEGVRSYAGAPITVNGHVIGACCVLDFTPHCYDADQVAELRVASASVAAGLERAKAA